MDLVAGHDRRVDLGIASLLFAAIIDVRGAHAKYGGAVRDICAVADADAMAGGDRVAEAHQEWISAGTIKFGRFDIVQHPDADAVTVRRRFASTRLAAARFAAILEIDAEES